MSPHLSQPIEAPTTMSQLLRRTKKCCVKLLRKLSLSSGSRSPSPVSSATRSAAAVLNNSKMKYCQQKNKSPSHRCYHQVAPSPQHAVRLRFGRSVDELNYSMAAFDESDADRSLRNFKDLQRNNKRIFLNRDEERSDHRQQSQIFMGPNMNNMMCLTSSGGRSKTCKKLFPPVETSNGNRTDEILFEKVHYDRNKKYFHNTPSTLSSPSRLSLSINNLDFTLASATSVTNRRLSSEHNPYHTWQTTNTTADEDVFGEQMAEFVDDGEDDLRNPWENDYRYHNLNRFKYEKIKFKNEPEHAWEHSLDTSAISSDSNPNQHQPSTNHWGGFFSTAAAASSNHTPYNSSTKTTDIWENFQNKAYEIDFEHWQSSRRSSIDTVETWIEDEVFDNSFNEELERRVAEVLRNRQQ